LGNGVFHVESHAALNILFRKDAATYAHSMRVGEMAQLMALQLHMDPEQTRQFVAGCLLHDIGKALIPDEILNKDSSLTAGEWEVMKNHPIMGVSMAPNYGIENRAVLEIILYHHERWDGKGYPYGLRAKHIPMGARICSIIDSFDCMIHDRPYKKAMSIQSAKDELWRQRRKQFDSDLVEMFLRISEERLNVFCFTNSPMIR